MRKIPPVSEMEHITSKEFGENMDTVLDRITKEDMAIIIDHEDKSYVLCPASWFEMPEMRHVETMLQNAVRYVATVDDRDLKATVETVREFLPALSKDCIQELLGIIGANRLDTQNKQWAEMKAALEEALVTTEKLE